ncbi:NB-ARC domain-containing protein [Amycolatopsis thailandensis]|uniref:NB-ARC domain-containing protein n=1 Tax=Amycolatopsis thailandensis TaxID=589330 RepID=UPI00363D4FF2
MTEIREVASTGNAARPYLTLAERFRAEVISLCDQRGWALRELSRRAFLDVGFLSKLIRGLVPATVDVAKALDTAFGTGTSLQALVARIRSDLHPQLPVGGAFVGREGQRARLDGLVAQMAANSPSEVAVLAGTAGAGKTSLAVHWANSQKTAFDVILWADLYGFTGDQTQRAKAGDILGDLLKGLNVPVGRIPVTDDERLQSLRGHLNHARAARVLIVLDNAFDLAQVKPVLPGTPGTLVLITSRTRIRGLAQVARTTHVPVTSMTETDSVDLISSLIGRARAAQEPDAVARVVDLCASLPLALSIAGNLIAADPATSVLQHAEALADRGRLHMLDGDDTGIGVRAAISWSIASARPDETRLFCLLGIHPGPRFTSGAAAALAGLTETETLPLLDRLVDAHLIQRHQGGYRFHDLLRDYATEEIRDPRWETERRTATERLIRWYVHSSHAANLALTPLRDHHEPLAPPADVQPATFDNASAAFAWCTAELSNVTPVSQLALEQRMWWAAWRLPTVFIDYYIFARPLYVWTSSMEIALISAENAGEDLWLAEAADKLAAAFQRMRDYDRADDLSRRAIALTKDRIPVYPRLGWSYMNLGVNAHVRGDVAMAVDLIGQGVDAFVAGGSRIGELAARIEWGTALCEAGDRDRALQQGRLALAGFRANGDSHGLASALAPLARTCRAFGEVDEALACSDEAAQRFHTVGDAWGEADALEIKGLVLADRGHRAAAVDVLTAALTLVETLDEVKADQLRRAIEACDSAGSRT